MKTCSMCGGYIADDGETVCTTQKRCMCGITIGSVPVYSALRIELTEQQLNQLAEQIALKLRNI